MVFFRTEDTTIKLGDAIRSIRRHTNEESGASFGLRLDVSHSTLSRYESGQVIPPRDTLVTLFQLAASSEEKAAILTAMGVDEAMGWPEDGSDVPINILQVAKEIEEGRPQKPWKRGALRDFAEVATLVVKEVRDVDPALTEILRSWVAHHADARAVEEFRDVAAYLNVELSKIGAERVAGKIKKKRHKSRSAGE